MKKTKIKTPDIADMVAAISELEIDGLSYEIFLEGQIMNMPSHVIITSRRMEATTDMTVYLYSKKARVSIYRPWANDSAPLTTINYGKNFGDDLRALIKRVDDAIDIAARKAIESLIGGDGE